MKYFNENMTSTQARNILFSSVDHMSKAEVEEIKKEYREIAPALMERELKENEGWLTEEAV